MMFYLNKYILALLDTLQHLVFLIHCMRILVCHTACDRLPWKRVRYNGENAARWIGSPRQNVMVDGESRGARLLAL